MYTFALANLFFCAENIKVDCWKLRYRSITKIFYLAKLKVKFLVSGMFLKKILHPIFKMVWYSDFQLSK